MIYHSWRATSLVMVMAPSTAGGLLHISEWKLATLNISVLNQSLKQQLLLNGTFNKSVFEK